MKTVITVFSTILFISTTILAQLHTISYSIDLQYNCDENSVVFIDEGSIKEGEQIVFPQYTIPEEYQVAQKFQKFLDLFEGTIVEVPEGTLNEDVTFKIVVNPFPCDVDDINFKHLFGITFVVIGSNTGEHLPLDYYHFNAGKKAIIKIKSTNLMTFLTNENMTIEKIMAWFVDHDLEEDLKGISFHWSFDTMEYAEIHLEHFSKVVIGINSSATSLDEEEIIIPNSYKLNQNYPNPFNPTTIISYSLPGNGFTRLTIYNSLGVKIATLVNGLQEAGNYKVQFNSEGLTTGIYFYKLEAGNFESTKKMILLK